VSAKGHNWTLRRGRVRSETGAVMPDAFAALRLIARAYWSKLLPAHGASSFRYRGDRPAIAAAAKGDHNDPRTFTATSRGF
jgi:hypothetical protein